MGRLFPDSCVLAWCSGSEAFHEHKQFSIDYVCLNRSPQTGDEYASTPCQVYTAGAVTLRQLPWSERLRCVKAGKRRAPAEVPSSLVNICQPCSLTLWTGFLPIMFIHFSLNHTASPKVKAMRQSNLVAVPVILCALQRTLKLTDIFLFHTISQLISSPVV